MSFESREIHLAAHPQGLPTPNQFEVATREIGAPADGDIVVRNLYMSVDPALRRPLSDGTVELGKPIIGDRLEGAAIGEVVASRHDEIDEGDIVEHALSFCEYAKINGNTARKLDIGDEPVSAHLGVLGITGLTAYVGMLDIGELKDGENVFVSAAAGAVGSLAAQIAKIKDCYVIGSTGSDAKCNWLRDVVELDAVINYKDGVLRKSLKAAAPHGIDVYFDNVGGEHLNATLPRMNRFGRVAACGMISSYNDPYGLSEGVTTLSTIMYNRVTIKGFTVTDHFDRRPQFLTHMREWMSQGKIKTEETVYDGIEKAPDAIIGLFTGENLGKSLIKLS